MKTSSGTQGGRTDVQRGFTLIEMLVVVALIAATAAVALLITGRHDQQSRRETTVRLMGDIVRAVAGDAGPVWSGETRLSGFVVDNGRLPANLFELTARDALVDEAECGSGSATAAGKFSCHKARAAVFDPTPGGDDGAIEPVGGDEMALTDSRAFLPKGMRRYLDAGGGSSLRDGWGNRAIGGDDDANVGWVLGVPATATGSWRLTSLGSNNALDASPPDPDEERVADITRSVRPEDWSQDIQGWTVRLVNGTGADLTAGAYVGASLLVWENRAGGGTWRRFTTELLDSGLTAGASVDLVFPAGGYPGGGYATTRVPIGEHVLVGVRSANAVAHDADDAVLEDVDGAPVLAHVRLFPGAARPVVELVLR